MSVWIQLRSAEDPVWPFADKIVWQLKKGRRLRTRFESDGVRGRKQGLLLLADVPTLSCSYMTGDRRCGTAVLLLLAPHSCSSS